MYSAITWGAGTPHRVNAGPGGRGEGRAGRARGAGARARRTPRPPARRGAAPPAPGRPRGNATARSQIPPGARAAPTLPPVSSHAGGPQRDRPNASIAAGGGAAFWVEAPSEREWAGAAGARGLGAGIGCAQPGGRGLARPFGAPPARGRCRKSATPARGAAAARRRVSGRAARAGAMSAAARARPGPRGGAAAPWLRVGLPPCPGRAHRGAHSARGPPDAPRGAPTARG
jgi:hypothetical protein